jgi:hypothetical protein
MSVVHSETIRRGWVVAAVVAWLVATPPVVSAVRRQAVLGSVDSNGSNGSAGAAALGRRALASGTVAYSGLAEGRGGTSLPDLPQLADVTALLGGTTRTRVWWASPGRWRVDTLSTTGEQGTYGVGDDLVVWEYEANWLTTVRGSAAARLPRADDLLPPQAARRILAGLGPTDLLTADGAPRVVAGRACRPLRVTPADRRSTVSSVDICTDDASGLPLALTVRGPDGVVALESRFVDLTVGAPADQVLDPPAAPGAVHDEQDEADLVNALDRRARAMPDRLGGLDRSPTLQQGTATYGDGLTRFVVVPLPRGLGGQTLTAARAKGATALSVTAGEALLLRSGVLTVVVARRGTEPHRTFLLSGLVDADTLRQGAQDLFDDPVAGQPVTP